LESRATFEQNLIALNKRFGDLVEALRDASTEDVEAEIGPRGAHILRQGKVRLGSAYDPEREGQQIAERMAEEPADIMVAVGFGLGEQFAPYLEMNPATLIIYEPSLARLKAGLQRISFKNLLATHRDVYFATDLTFLKRLLAARYVPGLRLRVFPHPAVLRLDRAAVAEVVEETRVAKQIVDLQRLTSIEMLMPWAWVTANNGRRIAQSPPLGVLKDVFLHKPAVVVAAGPSLDKQLPLLREIQDRVVIIGIGQTTNALRQAGIEPHILHVLESTDVSHQLTAGGDTGDLITAPSADAHPAIFDIPSRARFAVTTSSSAMGVWVAGATGEKNFSIGGGTVAHGAVGIGLLLGCNPIALIGQDLAFTDGRVYAANSSYDFMDVKISEEGDCKFTGWRQKASMVFEESDSVPLEGGEQRLIWVDSWEEGKTVPTYGAYAAFLEQYRDIGLSLARRGWSLINCTEGGARIPEIEHRSFRSFVEEFATEELSIREVILEKHDSAPRYSLEDYRDALDRAERQLAKVESESKKGSRFVKRSRDALRNARNDQQRAEILRGIARHEKRVKGHLETVPWLDALVQPEIYNMIAAVRRTERQEPSDDDLIAESSFLFEAAENGVARARQWFKVFEESFESTRNRVVRFQQKSDQQGAGPGPAPGVLR